MAKDVVYVANGSGVKAFQASSGRQLWTTRIRGYFLAVGDGGVYASTIEGNLVALDAVTGAVRWSMPVDSSLPSAPALAYGRVYVHTPRERRLSALDADTGTTIWSVPTGDPPAYSSGASWHAAPVVANGVSYVVADTGTIEALDAATGDRLWVGHESREVLVERSPDYRPTPTIVGILSHSLAVVDGRVYVGTSYYREGLIVFGLPPPSLSLAARSGPPTSTVNVSGRGFAAHETVELFFDAAPVGSASASGAGSFTVSITVHASALPGDHQLRAVGSASSAQASFLVQTNWAQPGFSEAHTGYNRYENVLNAVNIGSVRLRWEASPGEWSSAGYTRSSPAVVNGAVYVAGPDGLLHGFNATTGALRWSIDGYFFGSPAVANRIVYAASGLGVFALSPATGATIWSTPLKGELTVAGGRVYVSGRDGTLHALDALSGTSLWRATIGGDWVSGAAVAGGRVFVRSSLGTLHALDAATGASLWTAPTDARPNPAYSPSPVVAGGIVYVTSRNGVFALKASSGALLWKSVIYAFGWGDLSRPAVANGVVYVGARAPFGAGGPDLYAFPVTCGTGGATCAPLWVGEVGGEDWEQRSVVSAPTVANGLIYVGLMPYGGVAIFRVGCASAGATCTPLDVRGVGGGGPSSLTVVNGMVYAATEFGLVASWLPR